jgi:molybdate transport system regulatory protein
MEPKLKVWVESGGALVLSDYRVRLLELVDETGSLADAAARMGLSYRRAWGKLKEIEANLGLKLVESTAGGPGGGHTSLTAAGRDMVERYKGFRSRLSAAAEAEFVSWFGAQRSSAAGR